MVTSRRIGCLSNGLVRVRHWFPHCERVFTSLLTVNGSKSGTRWASEVRTSPRKVVGDADLSAEVDAIRGDVQKLAATIGDVAKRQAGRAQDSAVGAMRTAEDYVRQNALRAVAIAAGLGFIYGVFTHQ